MREEFIQSPVKLVYLIEVFSCEHLLVWHHTSIKCLKKYKKRDYNFYI
jgi:hypothetical protein